MVALKSLLTEKRSFVPGRWIMFYEAVSADNTRSISLAVSKDGVRDWQRLGRPILEAGQLGSWDAGGVCTPSVVSMAGAHALCSREEAIGSPTA